MRLSCILVLGSLIPSATYAQQPSIQQTGNAAQANIDALVAGAPTVLPHAGAYGIKGSPYLDDRWLPARLLVSGNRALVAVPLKFDVLNQQLLLKPVNRPNDSIVLDDRRVIGFELDEPIKQKGLIRTRVFRRFNEAPTLRQQLEYVEVLHQGRYTLLKHYFKQLTKATYQQAYTSGKQFDEIEDRNQYFLLRPDKTLVSVKLMLKTLQAAALDLAPALEAAAAVNKAKTEAELVAVLAAADPKQAADE